MAAQDPASPEIQADDSTPETVSDQFKDLFPPFEPAFLDSLRDASPEIVEKYDAIVMEGMNAFFNNNFAHADSLFRATHAVDPLCANAWGTLGTIKALLSFEPYDIEFASSQLVHSAAFGNGVQPKGKGLIRGFSNWWNRKTQRLTPYQFRALVVVGESEMLRANVLLIQDSMSGYLKAGLALRRGYNIYDRLLKYLNEFKDDHGVDANSIGGVHFGIGAIHLVTSILPPKILMVLKALGYMHDRAVGFDHLHQCLTSHTLRSPIASLLLLAFHGILPSFASLTAPRNIPLAESVVAETLKMYPKSIIHLWLSGRVERLKRNTDAAIAIFQECVNHGAALREALPQLEHFALYDLAWSYVSRTEWLAAIQCFRRLELESNWSQMFYAYAQAACYDMLAVDAALEDQDARRFITTPGQFPDGDALTIAAADGVPTGTSEADAANRAAAISGMTPELRVGVLRILARRSYQRSIGGLSFKVAGKIISVEQFAKRRLKHHMNFHRTPMQTELSETNKSIFEGDIDEATARKMAEGLDAEVTASTASAQDDTPLRLLTGIELANHFNVFTQTEDPHLNKMLKYVTFFEETVLTRASGDDVAVSLIIKANLLRSLKRPECAGLYDELLAAPPPEAEKWVQPYALYGKGVWQFDCGEVAESRETLTKTMQKKFGGKDYNFEMQMGFRLHLTGDMFRQDDAAARSSA